MKIIKHMPRRQNQGLWPDLFGQDDPFSWLMTPVGAPSGHLPSMNISEDEKEMRVELSVPDYDPENIEVEIDHDTLSISGHVKEEKEEKNKKWHRREFMSGEFHREIGLPGYLDTTKAKTALKKGVLCISIPKSKAAAKKKLKVAAEK